MKTLALLIFVLSLVACRGPRNWMRVKEKREIPLYTKTPVNAFIFKRDSTDQFTFYIERNELKYLVDSVIKPKPGGFDCRNLKNADYFSLIDSLQKNNGLVDVKNLLWCEHWLTEEIIWQLLPKGNFWIRYSDGKFVKAFIYKKTCSRMLQKEYYNDKNNGKNLYFITTLLQGGHF